MSLWLSCQASSVYHNAIAYNAVDNQPFIREIEKIEESVGVHMEATSSETDGEEDKVYSDEDIVYENLCYI